MYEIGTRISFFKQYRYLTNHLHFFVTKYNIFVFTVTLLLVTMCLSLVDTNTSSNTTLTTTVICHEISKGLTDLFLLLKDK